MSVVVSILVFGLSSFGFCEEPPIGAPIGAEDEIAVLYREGVALYESGQAEEAKGKFKKILEINPRYEPARSKLRVILDEQTRSFRRDKIIAGKERLLEVQEKWIPPESKDVPEEEKSPLPRFKTEQQRSMEERASQVIPEINFTDAHLRDVMQYMSRISGINIILDEDIFVRSPDGEIGIPSRVDASADDLRLPAQGYSSVLTDRVTIALKNIPLIEALKYILSAKGLKYRIDEYAIVVSTPQRLDEVDMETRYYHLASGVGSFTEYLDAVDDQTDFSWLDETDSKKGSVMTIKDVLEQSGVPFPAGSRIFLDQRSGTLIIRNNPSNLAVMEDILRALDVTPYQIEIEARFVQIASKTAEELGLEWMITSSDFRFGPDKRFRWDSKTTDSIYGQYPDPLGQTGRAGVTHGLRFLEEAHIGTDAELTNLFEFASATAGNPVGNMLSLSGILTQPQFRVILHALNQSGDANLVSSPKVTTLNNQRAVIGMGEKFRYPEEYALTSPTVNACGNMTTRGIAVPISFTTRDLGVHLNVTPSVGADRKTITLTLIPEIIEFIDWIDYGIPVGTTSASLAIPIVKPVFQTRSVTTSVVLNDGETVVLGGLVKEEVETSEDKIPLLGDLPMFGSMFRSKRDVSRKTNLVIFVTARVLTPSGELMRESRQYAY